MADTAAQDHRAAQALPRSDRGSLERQLVDEAAFRASMPSAALSPPWHGAAFRASMPSAAIDQPWQRLEAEARRDAEILRLIAQLRDCFENHFDRTWFSVVIDGIPVDPRTVREIRLIASLRTLYPGEEQLLWQGVAELETFIAAIRRFLLPVLRERLGISWLLPARRVRDRSQCILRTLVAFTFPYNLERLRALTQRLRSTLLAYYPDLAGK